MLTTTPTPTQPPSTRADLAARVSYVLGAAETFAPDADDGGAADILFSNAALHWVPDHTGTDGG